MLLFNVQAIAALFLGASTISARHVKLTWRDQGADTGAFYWSQDMGNVKSIDFPVADDGTTANIPFHPVLKPLADGTLLQPTCWVRGTLKRGLESTTFVFQQGKDYLAPGSCGRHDRITVWCEGPKADC